MFITVGASNGCKIYGLFRKGVENSFVVFAVFGSLKYSENDCILIQKVIKVK